MRSRFLNIDYSTLGPSQSRETLTFLHLPVPHLPSPPPFNVEDHLSFHSTLDISLDIERLPIDDALSKFLSDVLPHSIDSDFHCFEASIPSSSHNCFSSSSFGITEDRISDEAEGVFEENGKENRIILGSEADTEFPKESKMTGLINENQSIYNMAQFETPELDVLLENACFLEELVMQMLYETSENEIHRKMLKSELSMHFPFEVLDSVSLVEHVTSEYLTGQNAYFSEDYMSVLNLSHFGQSKFPILEVDEESLGILTCSSMEENVGSHFDSIRPQNMDEKCHTVIEGSELLGSMKRNMMEFLSDDCLSKQSVVLSDMLHERDFIIMLETEHLHGNFALQGKSQSDSFLSDNLITFQEFLFLDENLIQIFEGFYNTKTLDDPEIIDWMFKKELNFRNFDELIVSNEIALLDDTFKSLPVPVISDYGKMISLHVIIEELLSNLKTHPQSASDGIYLNWDLLEEDKSNCNIYHFYHSMSAKIDVNNIDFEGKSSNDGRLVFDLVFSSDTLGGCDIKQSEELQELLSYCDSLPEDDTVGVASSNLLDGGSPKQGSGEQLAQRNAERASLLFKSMSEVSHLDYFLNPQKATASGNFNFAVESTNADVNVPKVTSPELKASCRYSGLQPQGWHIHLRSVMLCDNIMALIANFSKCYWAVLETETELTQTHNSSIDHFQLLRLPKHELMKLHENGKNMAFIVLYAIKQASWYLCFYGLHPACLYVDKLCQNLDYLKSRFSFLQSLIKDEKRKVDDNIIASHPSLAVLEEILQSNVKQDGLKVLLVAEEIFWWSLKSLLLSMGLSFNVLDDTNANQPYAYNMVEDAGTEMKNLMISDCLVVSYKHVSPFFPFNKFGVILEYGGPNDSSRISNLSPNSDGLPRLHFLNVELDVHSAVKALCEGVEMPPNTEMSMENETHEIVDSKERLMNPKLEKLLNVCPLEQNYDSGSSKAADEIDCFVPSTSAGKSEHSHQSMESFPETIIIVNTQNEDKEMIVSRRSTYQVILSMEKRGAQVVERDLNLPVDIIISSAICLVWYDCRNLGKKATPVTEASSSVPLYIENIATNILTLLSFSFGGCFLVFEGDVNFISTVMESSDGLYAAAASLGIHLQIFFSYLPELTNEIIVNCINHATKLTRGLYHKMPDSVSLAESFWTQFPSVNPLTAHAILSSGTMLTEFLGWSHEQRIRVLEQYHVPEESVALVNALCKYGEREDSKSIMTDCSSSVSSGPDSDRCHLYQVDCERKRKKHMGSPEKFEPCLKELLHCEPLHQVVDGFLDSSTLSKPSNPCMSKDGGRYTDLTNANMSMSDLFGPKRGFNVTTTMRSRSRVSQPSCDSWSYKSPPILEQIKQPCLSVKDEKLDQNDILDAATVNKNLTWHGLSYSEKLHEDIRGEVVDLTDIPLLNENFSFIADSLNFPSLMTETEKDQRKNKIAGRMSFDKSSQPEANFSNVWRSLKDTPSEINNDSEPDFGMEVFPLDTKYREKISDEDLTPVPERNLHVGLPFQEMSHLCATPLSRALQSASPLKSSPWTLEFINRVKEKSKLRQKALSCENSAPCFGYSGNMRNVANRRRPPIIELFTYQGSRTENIPQQKRQKQCVQAVKSAKNGNHSASLLPTWTPNDKKATKALTFAMNENGSQSKLVWNDVTQGVTKKLRY